MQACASGTVAVGRAWQAIAEGRADCALAGGSEYLDDPRGSIFLGFDICRALVRDCDPPEKANRPFDAARSGFLFAQGGAAMLMLESAEHAAARGARALAEVVAFAESFDAHSMMSPEPHGRAMETMLRDLLARGRIGPTALSLRDQRLHPSRNLSEPIADLDFVTHEQARDVRFAVSQSFAFGGHNAALLMARADVAGG